MALEYLREYRTYAHIGISYGYSESQAFKIITWVENTLTDSGKFSLPGKKALLNCKKGDIVLIDATESPLQRPKKKIRASFIQEKRSGIQLKLKSLFTKGLRWCLQ